MNEIVVCGTQPPQLGGISPTPVRVAWMLLGTPSRQHGEPGTVEPLLGEDELEDSEEEDSEEEDSGELDDDDGDGPALLTPDDETVDEVDGCDGKDSRDGDALSDAGEDADGNDNMLINEDGPTEDKLTKDKLEYMLIEDKLTDEETDKELIELTEDELIEDNGPWQQSCPTTISGSPV